MYASITLAASRHDRRRALAFVRRHARQRYGGFPPPSQIMLFAEQNRRICGTIALDFADGTKGFPLEAIYRIARLPWAFERKEIAQFGKWWSTRPGIALYLMQAAHMHALAEGKRFGLVEAKPRIVARVEEFGMELIEVPGAVLLIKEATPRSAGYYASLPPPRLYMFDIPANAAALARYIKVQQGC